MRLLWGAVLALALTAGFLSLSLSASHTRYRTGAVADLQNLTLSLERYLFARLRAADLEGRVIYGPGVNPAKVLSIAERGFFKKALTTTSLVIGLPLRSRISHRWVLPLAKDEQVTRSTMPPGTCCR